MHFYARKRADDTGGNELTIAQAYAEAFVSVYLRAMGWPDMPPELDDARIDLIYRDIDRSLQDVAVAVCNAETRHRVKATKGDEYAWTFEWADGKPAEKWALLQPDDLIALVFLDDGLVPVVRLVALVQWGYAQKLMVDPSNPRLTGKRKTLFYAPLNLKVR
jgi:hypothetical protein